MKILRLITFILLVTPLTGANHPHWVRKTLKRLTLKEKIGQMIIHVVRPNFVNQDSEYYAHLKYLIKDLKVGGLHVFKTPTYDLAFLLNKYHSWAKIPLLISADLETGAGNVIRNEIYIGKNSDTFMPEYFSGGGVRFPPLMALGATRSKEFAYQMGKITAIEARSVGIHINFSPVMDVNNNPDNPIINVRSFAERVDLVCELGSSFIHGCQDHGLIATAKHFPGHGDTAEDTHINLPVLNFNLTRLQKIELPPFEAAINAGVKAIMSAHIALPAVTNNLKPATLSKNIITGILKEQMGFKGLIITDAMVMGGITEKYNDRLSAIEAVKAGVDLLLYFSRPEDAVEGILSSVKRGEIKVERINRSVKKILEAKKWSGLHRNKRVDINKIDHILGSKKHLQVAIHIANSAITLLKNSNHFLPFSPENKKHRFYLIKISDTFEPERGLHFESYIRENISLKKEFYWWQESHIHYIEEIIDQIPEESIVICPVFIFIRSSKGKLSVPEAIVKGLTKLVDKGCKVAVISFGSPYIYSQIPFVTGYLCAYFSTRELEVAAAKVLLGSLTPVGKLPVTIPGHFTFNDGLSFK